MKKEKKVLCIYHKVDLDGVVSAATVVRRYGAENVTLVGWNYGDAVPITDMEEAVKNGHLIILVDVSFSVDVMQRFSAKTIKIDDQEFPLNFVWIDHHSSALQESERSAYARIKGLRTCKRAACELTYEFLFGNGKPTPPGITLLGQYDSWRQDETWEQVLNFQYGMRQYGLDPLEMPEFLFETHVQRTINATMEEGKAIRKYLRHKNQAECKLYSFEAEICGLKAICLNTLEFQSHTFASVYDEKKHDLMCSFVLNGWDCTMSLRSTKAEINCGEIAQVFGGGGHKGSASFKPIWAAFENFLITKRLGSALKP